MAEASKLKAVIGLVLVAALIFGFFYAFSYAITIVYFIGMVATLAFGLAMQRHQAKAQPRSRQQHDLLREFARRRHGRVLVHIATLVYSAISLINWPVDILRGVYIAAHSRLPPTQLRMAVGQAVVPAWFSPLAMTMLALALLLDHAAAHPLKLVAICFVVSIFLSLISSSFLFSVKEDVLLRPGNPKFAFFLMLLMNLGAAALARLLIGRWGGIDGGSILESVYAILSFADVRVTAEQFGLLPAEVAADPARLRNLPNVPLAHFGRAALDLLFYLGFARIAFEIFSAKREERHYALQGMAQAVLGIYDKAEKYLAQAKVERHALATLSAIRLRNRQYRELTRSVTRLCGILGMSYAPEEEAIVALVFASDGVECDGKAVADFLDARAAGFTDPGFAPLLAVTVIPVLSDVPDCIESLSRSKTLEANPLFELFLLDLNKETQSVRQRLPETGGDSLSATLLRIMLGFSSLLDDVDEKADPNWLAHLDREIDTVRRLLAERDEQWQLVLAYSSIQRAMSLHVLRFGTDHPRLAELAEALLAPLRQSEYLAEMVDAVKMVDDRTRAKLAMQRHSA